MSIILAARPPLTYPGGSPGIDWSHPASRALKLSAVASPVGYINLLNGKAATKAGAPTFGVSTILGPRTSILTRTAATNYSFPYLNVADPSVTIATIASVPTVTSGTDFFLQLGGSNGGVSLFTGNGDPGELTVGMPGVANFVSSPTIDLVINVPYFIVISVNGATGINFLALRLDNGRLITSTSASGAVPAPGTGPTFNIGADANGFGGANSIAAVMYSANYLTMPQMIAWAQQGPWNFWYPNPISNFKAAMFSQPALVSLVGRQQLVMM